MSRSTIPPSKQVSMRMTNSKNCIGLLTQTDLRKSVVLASVSPSNLETYQFRLWDFIHNRLWWVHKQSGRTTSGD